LVCVCLCAWVAGVLGWLLCLSCLLFLMPCGHSFVGRGEVCCMYCMNSCIHVAVSRVAEAGGSGGIGALARLGPVSQGSCWCRCVLCTCVVLMPPPQAQ
jgi:hypothetical protein